MAVKNRITFFACDNGDASLIEAHGWTIMTDINYRDDATDDDKEEILDFAPKVRNACDDDHLDVFVLTHPDEDHLRGFGEVFHLGTPDDHDADPAEGPVKIVVDEIWCSEYSANPNYDTKISKPVLDEIKRRKKLIETEDGKKAGNRLRVLNADENLAEKLTTGINWILLAPLGDEADIPQAEPSEDNNSANPSSLVIRWTITVGGTESKALLAGDASVEIWERLNEDSDDTLEWHIFLAPHHCSRHSLGREDEDGFTYSDDALEALNHPLGSQPHIVASSRKFKKDTPPSPEARKKYYEILAMGDPITESVKRRFKCTAGTKADDEPEDIIFNFTSAGPSLVALAAPVIARGPTTTGGGGYGAS